VSSLLAHTIGGPGGIEIELLFLGGAILFLAYLFRPSQTGGRSTMVMALGVGVVLVAASIVVPRL
jgi:hypothetical protein